MIILKIVIMFFDIAMITSLLTYNIYPISLDTLVQSNKISVTTTTTPIKHLIIIFQENTSFDHYFGTYPKAANLKGEPIFNAIKGTPKINGLNNSLLI